MLFTASFLGVRRQSLKRNFLAAPAAALLLSGCQLPAEHAPVKPVTSPHVSLVTQQQQRLWLAGAINTQTSLTGEVIQANSSRVTVDWEGDAIELLSYLARQRGLTFNWTGVRLPLPVNVHVNGVTYQNLLRMIELQTAWRATLHEFPGQLTLAFAQPDKPRGRA